MNFTKTVTLSAPLLPGDTLTLTVKAPAPVVPAPPPTPTPTPVPPPVGVPLTNAATPNVAAPAIGQSITDSFGNRVWCVSTTHRHRYPLNQAWNCGIGPDSRILLDFRSGSAPILLGVAPYTLQKTMQVPNEAIWSNKDPWTLYGSQGNALIRMDIRDGRFVTVKDFGAPVSIGRYEGGISDDDRFIALDAGGRLIVWDLVANSELSSISMPSVDGYQISRRGGYVVIRGGNTRVLFAGDLSKSWVIDPRANHGGVCLFGGEDYYVGNNAVIGTTAMGTVAYRLSDGKATVLLPRRNAFEDGHTSGHGPLPMVSNYDATTQTGHPGRDQLVAVNFDGTVIPFGWAHHLTPDSTANYVNQPHATLDRTGNRALFRGWDSVAAVVERPA